MIRRSTVVWFSLAALAGFAMYQLKYDVVALEEKLAERTREILTYQESIHVLKAEWAYLNTPARLQELAERHLDLRPVSVDHEIQVGTLLARDESASATALVPTPRMKPVPAALRGREAIE